MQIEVFIVLREDEYETRFGDGYHAYFADAFGSRLEADAFVKAKNATSGYRYHVRPGSLVRDRAGKWSVVAAEPSSVERLDVNGEGVATDWAAFAPLSGKARRRGPR